MRLALQGEKNLMTARVSVLLKSRASPDMLPFSLCNKKKDLQFGTRTDPSFQKTINSVLRHREVGRAKDLSALLSYTGPLCLRNHVIIPY